MTNQRLARDLVARRVVYTGDMWKKRWWRRTAIAVATLIACATLFLWATNRTVLAGAEGRVYTKVAAIPAQPVALVLGTTPRARGGKNVFFQRRIEAAAVLYRAGKVDKVLVSGDHGTPYYDEPTAMKRALMAEGVPEKAIAVDYAGFRTLDSVVRAKSVFGLTRCAIVTDDFHLPRALYIASSIGLDAVGFQTRPVRRSLSPWTFVREVGSRTLVWIDLHVLHRKPRYLGPRIRI